MSELNDIKDNYQHWYKDVYLPFKERKGERKEKFLTTSGIEIDPLCTPLDSPEAKYPIRLGFPGTYPYTRGVYPTMYRGRLWTMRQYAGFGSAEETNKRFQYLLGEGQTGLSVAFDLPTQMGLDSNHPLAEGEVGRVGVAIDTMDDFRTLFRDIPLNKVSTSMTINATAYILLAMYVVLAEETGVPRDKIKGTIQNDILKEYFARGTYIYPPQPSMKIVTDIFEWCKNNTTSWNTISISGYHIREAGSTAVQEIAFTLADAIEYVEGALESGLDIDDFAPRLSFFFGVHNNLMEEVAKFRAARRIWARLMREKFNAQNERSCLLRFHTQTAGCTLTSQEPENNVIRVTLQALAAILGGTQSLHTNSKDEALSLPSEEAVLTALRTQQVIAEESGVSENIDPLGGSYFLEKLTNKLEEKILELMEKVQTMGGMVKAIEAQFPQREIEKSAVSYQRGIEDGSITVVGVNKYKQRVKPATPSFALDSRTSEKQISRLNRYLNSRNHVKIEELLQEVTAAAEGKNNVMPPVIEAVREGCTLGEISSAVEKVFGRYTPNI